MTEKIHLRVYPTAIEAYYDLKYYARMNPHATLSSNNKYLKFPNGEVMWFAFPVVKEGGGWKDYKLCGIFVYSVWVHPECPDEVVWQAQARVRYALGENYTTSGLEEE